MAIPPNDSGLRPSTAVAATLSDNQLSGSWRKKLRWWRWNQDVRGSALLTTIGGDPITTIGGDPITVN